MRGFGEVMAFLFAMAMVGLLATLIGMGWGIFWLIQHVRIV